MAEIIEIFPVNKGVIETDIDLFDENTTIKILGSDVIIEAGDKSLIIVYGAVFVSLGNVASVKDSSGKEITLKSLIYSPKVQYKESVTVDEQNENEDFLLIKDKDQSLVGQETTAEQEEVTDFSNPKYSKEEVEEIVDNAIAEAKNSEEESEEELEFSKNLKESLDERKEDFNQPPVEEIEDITVNTKSSDLDTTNTQVRVDLSTPVLLTPIWQITSNTAQNINGTDFASGDAITIENSLTTTAEQSVDLIATNTGFSITGQIDAEVTVEVSIASVASPNTVIFTANTISDNDGNWDISLNSITGSDAEFLVTVNATGINGGTSTDTRGLTLDTTTVTPTIVLDPTSDTGQIDVVSTLSDSITNINTPTLTGTAEAGASVVISNTNGATTSTLGTTIAGNNGIWTFVIPTANELTEGNNIFSVTVADIAGNTNTITQTIIVDVTNPTSTIDLVTSDDSGSANTDNITNINTPTITGTAEAGATVDITNTTTSVNLGSVTVDNDGDWSIVIPAGNPLSDGNNVFSVTVTDIAGNTNTSPISIDIQIDTTSPTSNIYLMAGDDSGASNTDNITNNTTPTIKGTAEAGATVEVTNTTTSVNLGSVIVNNDGDWTFVIPADNPLPEGINTLTAVITDIAGNINTSPISIDIQIDTTNPTSNIDLITADDSGASNTDNITNTNTPTITGTTEAGASVVISYVNGATTTTLGTTTAGDDGIWTFDIATEAPTGFVLLEGSNTLTAGITDIAGNNTSTITSEITIDNTPPNALRITNELAANISNEGIQIIEGSITNPEEGTVIELTLEPSSGEAIIIGTVTNIDGVGDWAFSFDPDARDAGGDLITQPGDYTFSATAIDVAGNSTPPATNAVNISELTAAPEIRVDASSDSAISNDLGGEIPGFSTNFDSVTNLSVLPPGESSITFSGTAVAGSEVRLFNSNRVEFGRATVSSDTGDGDGTWQFTADNTTVTNTLLLAGLTSEAIHTITAQTYVTAGLPSQVGSLAYIIDSTAPTPVTITSDIPVFSGSEATISGTGGVAATGTSTNPVYHAYVILELTGPDGTEYIRGNGGVDASGNWQVDITSNRVVTDGSYTITVIQVDAAGNQSIQNPTQAFTVQHNVLVVNTINTDSDGNPAGGVDTPTFSLSLLDGSVAQTSGLTVTVSHSSISSISLPQSTTVTNILGSDGTTIAGHIYTFNLASGTSLADNTGYVATTTGSPSGINLSNVTFAIDTTAPNPPTIELDVTSDGVVEDDNITPDNTPTLSGRAEAGSIIAITFTGITPIANIATTASPTGNWAATVPNTLVNGDYTASIVATDAFGNTSNLASYNFRVDTRDLVELTNINLSNSQVASDSDTTDGVGYGFINYVDNITFTGTGVTDATTVIVYSASDLRVQLDDSTISNGNWSLTLPSQATFSEGDTRDFYFVTEDDLGNRSDAVRYDLTFDQNNPNEPTITSVVENTDGSFTISGSDAINTAAGTDIASVRIYNSDNLYDVVTSVNADGTWTAYNGSALSDGTHSFTAIVVDAAGNQSSVSTAVTSSNINPTIQTTDSVPSTAGIIDSADGTLTLEGRGAASNIQVFIDANNNGVFNTGESQATIDVNTANTWRANIESIVAENTPNTLTITDSTSVDTSASLTVTYDDLTTA